jgi:hypothetical protein
MLGRQDHNVWGDWIGVDLQLSTVDQDAPVDQEAQRV